MHLLDQRTLGIIILFLLGMLVIVKRVATGSIVDKPGGSNRIQLANLFNLFFLLIVNPLAAVLLIVRQAEALDPTHLAIDARWLLLGMEIVGLALLTIGYCLMAWALTGLGRVYQPGGSAPRAADTMVVAGPYQLVRHPMYTAALCISLGLAGLLQSLACLAVFGLYLVLIVTLIPVEEAELLRAYGQLYALYRRHTGALIPHLY